MTNLTQTIIAMASGVVPLVPIVMGLVQWVKATFNTSDSRILNACAMGFGLVFGVGFMVAQQLPTDFTGWFIVVVYGIVLGLTASGLFKVGQQMATSSLAAVSTTTTKTVTTVEAKPDAVATPAPLETVHADPRSMPPEMPPADVRRVREALDDTPPLVNKPTDRYEPPKRKP